MEKTNFTFVRPAQWMKLAFMLVATLCFGLTPVSGQDDADPEPGVDICLPPALTVTDCYQDGATLTWYSVNGDHYEGVKKKKRKERKEKKTRRRRTGNKR
eukprot:TRINITY_DN8840_c1_g1_i1.p4 TRINITY_DN8840_c1_g1~~TRINITY_DN8840_c1_g1_i1.p4  ORF type:complete len:100 (-),score=12.69 TRINITY_DN8840_c1_g1_i1:92-391(-)